MTLVRKAKISLVGAGPGDPELITLRGVKALQAADVVLYDALAAPELLEHAPAHARRIFVGKRAGKHSMSQDEINLLMVQSALRFGHVVRLKGGDAFVFGRGYEEMAYAEAMNIAVEVVPGISSAIAVPELEGVPLTCRGMSESFWVITGSTRHDSLSKDLELAAQSKATVVILMGLRRIQDICQLFQSHGRGHEAAMVIRSGSRPESSTTLGQVNNLAERFTQDQGNGPGLIVIGKVVELHHQYLGEVALWNQIKQSA